MFKVTRFDEFIDEQTMALTFKVIVSEYIPYHEIFKVLSSVSEKSTGKNITDIEYLGDNEYCGYITMEIEEYEKLELKADKQELEDYEFGEVIESNLQYMF